MSHPPTHELSYTECESWMKDLGLDWVRFLREAGIHTRNVQAYKDNLKSRWLGDGSPEVRVKIRATLERLELRRRQRTTTGMRVLGLEEWNRTGRVLAQNQDCFMPSFSG